MTTTASTTAERPDGTPRPLSEIPGPKPLPVVGNMRDVDTHRLVQSIMELTDQYGPIFQLHTPGGGTSAASGLEMFQALCDDARFDKLVGTGQREIRKTHVSAGLFTADTA